MEKKETKRWTNGRKSFCKNSSQWRPPKWTKKKLGLLERLPRRNTVHFVNHSQKKTDVTEEVIGKRNCAAGTSQKRGKNGKTEMKQNDDRIDSVRCW